MKYEQTNNDIENYEFFKETSKDFYSKFSIESKLIFGKHREPSPQITILLTTYKRPNLLKIALDSALNQEEFTDYQVIVADNEGLDEGIDTGTSKLMQDYQDERVIYYRHESSVSYRMDYAARLAKSKWIVFLHDDDVLSPQHLSVMTRLIKRHPSIKYLSCPKAEFSGIDDIHIHKSDISGMPYIIKREPGSFTALDYYPGWLGAVINRDAYVSIGGIPNIDTGIGDCIMVGKFMKKYGIHELILNMHLYYYRRSEYQASAGGAELWTMAYGNEMQYHKYIAKQYHPLNKDRWYRLALYKLLRNSIECEHKYNMRVNIEKVLKKSNMPLSSLLINDNYRKDISCRLNYEIMKDMLFHPIKYKGAL